MRMTIRVCCLAAGVGLTVGCGGDSGSPATPSPPAPTPVPTPAPIGTIAFAAASLPDGATVIVEPMNETGQQAQQLWFSGIINLDRDMSGALVRAWVRTAAERCMGGGRAGVDFQAGVAQEVAPATMSGQGTCALAYTTTHVEFEVLEPGGESVLQQQFPMTYQFVPVP